MGRPRSQNGCVTPGGKKTWKGSYYAYVVNAAGETKKVHTSVCLGPRDEVNKTAAKDRLREIIKSALPSQPDNSCTLKWFIENK